MHSTRKTLIVAAAAALCAPFTLAPAHARVGAAAKPTISDVGFTFVPGAPDDTFAGEVTGAAVVVNPTTKVATDVEVTLAFEDAKGRTIIEDRTTLAYIAPGDEAYVPWSTTYPETKVPVELTADISDPGELVSSAAWAADAQYEFGTEVGADQPIPIEDVELEFEDLRYHDSSGADAVGLASSIVGSVHSASGQELAGLDVTCAAFEGGEIVGGGNMVLPVIPQDGDAGIQASGLLGGLEADEARCSGRVEYLYARVGTLEPQLVVQDAGFSLTSIDDYTMGAVIENPSEDWAWGLDYQFDVLDAEGRVIGSRGGDIPIYVAPKSTVIVAPLLPGAPNEFAGVPASVRVLTNAGVWRGAGKEIRTEAGYDPARWSFEFDDLAIDDLGNVTGTITNLSKKPLNALDVSCGIFRGGAIIGAASELMDESDLGGTLEPGVAQSFELSASFGGLPVDEIQCVGTIGGLSDV